MSEIKNDFLDSEDLDNLFESLSIIEKKLQSSYVKALNILLQELREEKKIFLSSLEDEMLILKGSLEDEDCSRFINKAEAIEKIINSPDNISVFQKWENDIQIMVELTRKLNKFSMLKKQFIESTDYHKKLISSSTPDSKDSPPFHKSFLNTLLKIKSKFSAIINSTTQGPDV